MQQLGEVLSAAVFLTMHHAAVLIVIEWSFPGLILNLTTDDQNWIALWTSESKTVILIYVISRVLGLSELNIKLSSLGEALACELRQQNYSQSELLFDQIVY